MKITDQNLKNGRRQFPTSLNLVPFIDLFSMIIIFLIITAVFDKLAVLQVNMGTEDKAAISVPTPDLKKIEARIKVTLFPDYMLLSDSGRNFKLEKKEITNEEGEVSKEYDGELLAGFMEQARERNPERKDIVIFSQDKAQYADLVKVMDFALAQKFTDLVVTGNK